MGKVDHQADKYEEMSRIHKLDDFFELLPIALYRSAPDGRLLAGNLALAKTLGFGTVDDMLNFGDGVQTFYTRPDARREWIEEISENEVVHDLDVELRRRDGTTLWVRDTARAVRDESGELVYFEGSLVDVTDKIRIQRSRDEFLATVSHELRNPITVILGLSEEMSDDYDGFTDDDRRTMIELIAREADEAAWMIEDLLVAHHDDINKISLAPSVFNIAQEIDRVVEVADAVIPVAGQPEVKVMADPGRTRQILRNLISNAKRYGGRDIDIEIVSDVAYVIVSVCDSGDPIDSEALERIFEPFERGDGPDHPQSVGIGLSVSRKLARLMGGDIRYDHQDGRSCFLLSLPVG